MKITKLVLLVTLSFIPVISFAADKPCPRIISQSPYISDMLDYLGLGQCIVGVSRYSKRDLPRTGGILDPDAEAIDALMPDLFITSDWTSPETVKEVTPEHSHAIRLSSFNKMIQLEQNMQSLIEVTGKQQASERVKTFAQQWRQKTRQVQGNNRKVLLLSSCSGAPYSFGPDSRLYDLFTLAGFHVIETRDKIRHIKPGEEIETLTALINQYQPELLFIFEQRLKKQCQMITPKTPVKILSFDGELFLHPSTRILQGLDTLIKYRQEWN